jgi:hypothetical protein
MTRILIFASVVFAVLVQPNQAKAQEPDAALPCNDGTCPTPADNPNPDNANAECDIWLAPSPIKNAESHGFGLGMFTGKPIPKGASVEALYGGSELLIPIFSSPTLEDDHPPLREYVWGGLEMPEVATEVMQGSTFLFMPGLAAIAPCTLNNYNLAWSGPSLAHSPRYNVAQDALGIHRSRQKGAGAWSYRNNVTYTAVRDISPGEELTVACPDDDYDGGSYALSHFQTNNDTFICVNHNLMVEASTIPGAGKGLFSKRFVSKDSMLISTPLIPMHRNDVKVENAAELNIPEQQLLLNYAYGHPKSDLLFLPYGPLVNFINHSPEPNAALRWHHENPNYVAHTDLQARQQHHHEELLLKTGETVAKTHGKGLLVDVVALRDLAPGEEIFLNYGPDWMEAWGTHVSNYGRGEDAHYVSAAEYLKVAGNAPIPTAKDLQGNPMPENLQIICFYNFRLGRTLGNDFFWQDEQTHSCLGPCEVLNRMEDGMHRFYSVKLLPGYENEQLPRKCHINREITVHNVPHNAIRIVDRAYTSDTFMRQAFRHEIGVPSGFYPEKWFKKKLRTQKIKGEQDEEGAMFKRKQVTKES